MSQAASASPFAAASGWQRLLATRAPGWSILVRLMVGLVVFFPEGIQKLVFPDILGAGRFAHIGIPFPGVMGPFCARAFRARSPPGLASRCRPPWR